VQELVARGAIAEAEMRTHPHRNYILRNLGDKPKVLVDLYQVEMAPGQSLLLCCDGLWEMVLDEQIRDIVNRHSNPQDACRELIQVANKNGGDDNITCILVRVESA
jgi:protein phosphatase